MHRLNEVTSSLQPFLSLPSTSLATGPGIQERPTVPAGFIPTGVATADFNNDGRVDWVVSNGGDNNLWLYLGNGDGTWQLPRILPIAGLAPVWVVTADLRGNGKQDIIVAEADSKTIGVFLGNGDGTFAAEQQYLLPDSPLSLAIGDFNNDGKLDVMAGLAPASGRHALAVLPGNGTGTLGTAVISSVASTVQVVPFVTGISINDMNKDGIPDALVVVNSVVGSAVLSFLGKGDGSFKQAQVVVSPFVIDYPAADAGDIDEDGCPDAVITDSIGHVLTFIGNCDGTFTQKAMLGLGDTGVTVRLRDINKDGHLDIVAGTVFWEPPIEGLDAGDLLSVMLGDGHGNFGTASVYRGDLSLVSLSFADLNGDGNIDIVSANQDGDSATVFLNDGSGGFGPPSGYELGYPTGNANPGVSGLMQVDLNGDGKKDLVTLELPSYPGNYQLVTNLGQGHGKFGPSNEYPVFPTTYNTLQGDFVLADFRNTGRPDFLAVGYGYVPFLSFAPNNGDGTFAAPNLSSPSTANGLIAVGDFNRDGKLDFVTVGLGNSANWQSLNVFLGNGDGTFNPQPAVLFGGSASRWPISVYARDLNADGKLDLLVYLYHNVVPFTVNDVYEFIGNGDGTFRAPVLLFTNFDPFTAVDLNGDGIPDLVTCKFDLASYPSYDQTPIVSSYLGRGDGTFSLAHTYSPYNSSVTLPVGFPVQQGTGNGGTGFCSVGDFDGNGKLDVAVFQRATGTYYPRYVQFLAGNGDGSFTPTYDVFRFDKPLFMPQSVLDMDGNGTSDLVELDWAESFNYLPGGTAPPFQIGLIAEPVVNIGQLQVILNVPSSTSTTIALTASDPNVLIPSSITLPAGSVSKIVTFNFGSSFDPQHVFSITGTAGGYSSTTYGAAWQGQFSTGLGVALQYPQGATIPGGTTTSYNPSVGTIGDYSTTATFSCSGLPATATCVFNPTTVYLDANTTGLGGAGASLVVATDVSISPGHYPFKVMISDAAVSASTPATLDVLAPGPDLAVSSSTSTPNAGVGTSFTITIAVRNGGNIGSTATSFNYSATGPATLTSVLPSQGTCSPSTSTCNLGAMNVNAYVSVTFTFQPNGPGSIGLTASATPTPNDLNSNNNSASANVSVSDFTMSVSPGSASTSPGQSAQYQLIINSVNGGFYNYVNFSCSGGSSNTQCAISPSSMIPGAGVATATVSVSVPAQRSAMLQNQYLTGRLPFALAVVLGLVSFRRHGKKTKVLTSSILCLCCLIVASCGGGSSSSGGGGNSGGGSSPSTYTLTFNATSGLNVKTATAKLTVQ